LTNAEMRGTPQSGVSIKYDVIKFTEFLWCKSHGWASHYLELLAGK